MSFSVGIFYSAQELLELVAGADIAVSDFASSFERFAVASAPEVLKFSQQCHWLAVDQDGKMYVTARGEQIRSTSPRELALRYQVRDAIEIIQPSWAQRIRHGRREVRHGLPADALQCMQEAGLWDIWTDDLIRWWDEMALAARARHGERLLEIGRRAERLSFEHEARRTGVQPEWLSLETNFSGFDIRSQIDSSDDRVLRIEVKGSHLRAKDAYFVLTRNEWDVAQTSGSYRFHLWLLRSEPPLLVDVDYSRLEPHVPENKGNGSWENCRIPFGPFTKPLAGVPFSQPN